MDLDTLLRETRNVPDPTPDALTTARARLDAATATATLRVAATRRTLERRRRRRVVLSVLVGAAASAALVLAPNTADPDEAANCLAASRAEAGSSVESTPRPPVPTPARARISDALPRMMLGRWVTS